MINAGNNTPWHTNKLHVNIYIQKYIDLCPFVSSWVMSLSSTCDGRVIAMIDGAPTESMASMKENAYIFHSH